VRPLIDALGDPEETCARKRRLGGTLGKPVAEPLTRSIGDERAVELLIRADRFLTALASADESAYARHGTHARNVREALQAIGEPAVEPLIAVAINHDTGIRIRWSAAETLASIGDRRALEPLTRLAESEGQQFAEAATRLRQALATSEGAGIEESRSLRPTPAPRCCRTTGCARCAHDRSTGSQHPP